MEETRQFNQFEYVNEYQKENYKRVTLVIKKEEYEKIEEYCKGSGLKVGSFIKKCIFEKAKRLKLDISENL